MPKIQLNLFWAMENITWTIWKEWIMETTYYGCTLPQMISRMHYNDQILYCNDNEHGEWNFGSTQIQNST